MDYSIQVKTQDNRNRSNEFAQFVSVFLSLQTEIDHVNIRYGNPSRSNPSERETKTIPLANVMVELPKLIERLCEESVVKVDGVWQAKREFRTKTELVSNYPITFTFFGKNTRSFDHFLFEESGDFRVNLPGYACTYYDQTFDLAEVNASFRRENIATLLLVVKDFLENSGFKTAFLTQSLLSSYGTWGAVLVGHSSAREFLNDIFRSLLVMHYITNTSEARKIAYPHYFAEDMVDPIRYLSAVGLERVCDETVAGIKRHERMKTGRLSLPVFDEALYSIAKLGPRFLSDLALLKDDDVLAILEQSSAGKLHRLKNGYLFAHEWKSSQGHWESCYHEIIKSATELWQA